MASCFGAAPCLSQCAQERSLLQWRNENKTVSRPFTFGIVGGYGATGAVVASELYKSCDGKILVGGRNIANGAAVAAKLGAGVLGAQVDVLNARSLDAFCDQCSIIINCAGPVFLLQDRVAQAAFRRRCHYVDIAGMGFVTERMLPQSAEIAALGLSCVVSAGWMPGISELVPLYANAQARAKMGAIESVTVYFADSGEWSDSALRDGVWYLRQLGWRSPGFFKKGEWVGAKMSVASRRVDLGDPVGSGRFSLFSTPELNEVGRQLKDCEVYTYSYLSGFRTAVAAILMAVVPLPEKLGVRLLRNVFREKPSARGRICGGPGTRAFSRTQAKVHRPAFLRGAPRLLDQRTGSGDRRPHDFDRPRRPDRGPPSCGCRRSRCIYGGVAKSQGR
jgi:hypothetical protein